MIQPYLHEWLFEHAGRAPEAPSVATPAERLTYGELADRVRALAGQLASQGIGRGDRVLIALPNSPATIVAALAVNAVGGVSVEVSHAWGPEAIAGILARTCARQAFLSGRDARAWGSAVAPWPIDRLWIVDRRGIPPAVREAAGSIAVSLVLEDGRIDPDLQAVPPAPMPALRPDDPALILYTSGSTGRPHGVIQTFRNVDANTRSIVEYLGLTSDDRALLTLPLHYCYGRSVFQTHLFVGGSLYLDNRFAFPRVVLEAMASEGCTGFAGVPLTFEIIRRQVDVASIDRSRLRYVTQAGGAMAPATIEWAREAFRPAQLYVMYGQTEATARLAYLPPERAGEKAGSVGIAIPGVELRVVDDLGREVPPGAVGELVARGYNVTPGYLDEPEETAAILHDGWLWTGDLAHRDDDGFFYIDGRAKDILKVGGHRVSPIEIERELGRHADVEDVAVAGMKDALMGEVPVAFVVLRRGAALDAEALRRHCQAHLPAHEVPARVVFVDALPRSEAGKLQREVLAARCADL